VVAGDVLGPPLLQSRSESIYSGGGGIRGFDAGVEQACIERIIGFGDWRNEMGKRLVVDIWQRFTL